jgi:hypothetical protein
VDDRRHGTGCGSDAESKLPRDQAVRVSAAKVKLLNGDWSATYATVANGPRNKSACIRCQHPGGPARKLVDLPRWRQGLFALLPPFSYCPHLPGSPPSSNPILESR